MHVVVIKYVQLVCITVFFTNNVGCDQMVVHNERVNRDLYFTASCLAECVRDNPLMHTKYLQIRVVSATIEDILNGDEIETKKSLRINQATYHQILQFMQIKHHGWSVDYELIIFLYWMASGCSYRVVGNFAGLSRYTIRNIIYKMLDFFIERMRHVVNFPREEELAAISSKFCSRAKSQIFGNAVGAIDGCHIRIKGPVQKHDEYINYKGFYSIVLQAVVDSKGLFRNYFIGYPGSVHDTRIFQNSPLYTDGQFPPRNYYLLGDCGYPCTLNPCAVITPYKNPNENQKKFNKVHSKARNVVECSFGIMKSRWRNIFFKALEQNLKNCVKIVTVACILHNICVMKEDFNVSTMEGGVVINVDNQIDGFYSCDTNEGVAFRDSLLERLLVAKNN